MKFKLILIALISVSIFTTSCTENAVTKNFGGDMNVELPANTKLVTATWKDKGSLWYLYKPRGANDQPTTTVFQEKSNYGIIEGKVIFTEK